MFRKQLFFVCVYLAKPQLHASNHLAVGTAAECVANLERCSTRHLFHSGWEECLLGAFSASVLGGEGREGGLSPVFLVRLHTLVLAVADNFLRVACARSRIHAAEENISIVHISSRGLYLIHEFQGASRPHQSLCVWLLMHKEAF